MHACFFALIEREEMRMRNLFVSIPVRAATRGDLREICAKVTFTIHSMGICDASNQHARDSLQSSIENARITHRIIK